jgi:hypothetical protein
MMGDLSINLLSGLKAIGLSRRTDLPLKPGGSAVCLGLLINLAIIGASEYLRFAGNVYFSSGLAAQLGAMLFLLLFCQVLLSGLQAEFSSLPRMMTATLYASAWYLALMQAAMALVPGVLAIRFVEETALCWSVIMMCSCLRIAFEKPLVRSYLLAGGTALACVLMIHTGTLRPGLLASSAWRGPGAVQVIDQEHVYYQQSRLVQEALAALEPQREGQADTYFVGFAGNGNEAVFGSEVRLARATVDSVFESSGRSVLLFNDIRRLEERPMANAYNLEAVLQSIGERMNTAEDVLFLFLSSHGSPDGRLQVAMTPFSMRAVSARDLRRMLDLAGIKWRIIVLSACYSGSFMEALATDSSLILAAAAHDKPSFGCSYDRDLTYFGEALFRDALTLQRDLVGAFYQARGLIEQRELARGLEASDPQIFLGGAMAAKIYELSPDTARQPPMSY